MAITLTHRGGDMNTYLDDADLDSLLAELDGPKDAEHPDVSVTHESGWALSAFPSGLVVWENVEVDGLGGHRALVRREGVRRLFSLLARDDIDAVESVGWRPGCGG